MDNAMKSHFVDRKGFFLPVVGLTLVPKGFSSCIPALKKMYRCYFVNLQKKEKKQLMHVSMDKNQLFIDVLDECFMVCL